MQPYVEKAAKDKERAEADKAAYDVSAAPLNTRTFYQHPASVFTQLAIPNAVFGRVFSECIWVALYWIMELGMLSLHVKGVC